MQHNVIYICALYGCNNQANDGFNFCSREHGRQFLQIVKPCPISECNKMTTPGYETCSRMHAIALQKSKGTFNKRNKSPKSSKICTLPDCTRTANKGFNFCCIAHGRIFNRRKHNNACFLCDNFIDGALYSYCSKQCHDICLNATNQLF